MKLKVVVVDLQLSRHQKLLGAAALGVAVALASTYAIALPVEFVSGDVLTAAQLNTNFEEVETRLAAMEAEDPTVTEWAAYVPVLRESGASPAPIVGHTTTGQWRRVGDSIEVMIRTGVTAPQTTTGGLYWIWDLPTGVAFDGNKFPGTYPTLGAAEVYVNGILHACIASTGSGGIALSCDGTVQSMNGGAIPAQLTNGSTVYIRATAPVDGWSVGD